MNDQLPIEIEQAIEQLRQRAVELTGAGWAPAWELARAIDELHAQWVERYTVRHANSAVGAFRER